MSINGIKDFSEQPRSTCQAIWQTSVLIIISFPLKLKKCPVFWCYWDRIVGILKVYWCHKAFWPHEFECSKNIVRFKMLVVHKFIKRSQIKNHAVDMSRLSGIFRLLLTQEIFPIIFTLNRPTDSNHFTIFLMSQHRGKLQSLDHMSTRTWFWNPKLTPRDYSLSLGN